MTTLPANLLPTNNKVIGKVLETTQRGVGIPNNLLSSTTNQLTSQVANYTSQLNNVTGQITNVTDQLNTLSAGAKVRLEIIEAAIPDNIFTLPNINGLSLGDIPDIEATEAKIKDVVDSTIERLNTGIPNLASLPQISGLIGTALSAIQPKIELPNLAEIKEVVYNKIKNLKRKQQAAIREAQLVAARTEETPFTARLTTKEDVTKRIINSSRGIYG